MHDYYCKNCKHNIGKWYNIDKCYCVINYCNFIESKNNEFIFFLDCKNCNKFVGILCHEVCINCFGKNQIFEEKKLFNWFLKYKKILFDINSFCKICVNYEFRYQIWFFEELTFYK